MKQKFERCKIKVGIIIIMMSVKIENHLASKLQSIALKLIAKNQYSNYLTINFYANEK